MDWKLYPHSMLDLTSLCHPKRANAELDYENDLMLIIVRNKERTLKVNFGKFQFVRTDFINSLFRSILVTKHICFLEFYECDHRRHFQEFVDFIGNHKELIQLKITRKADFSYAGAIAKTSATAKNINFTSLARAIAQNHNLRILELEEHSLSVWNVPDIGFILMNTPNLLTLNLSRNVFQDAGVIALAQILVDNKSVAFLNLQQNGVTEGGNLTCLQILESSYTICSYLVLNDISMLNRNGRVVAVKVVDDYGSRNKCLRWINVRTILADIYLALAPLKLPAYVMLWILDYLEPMALAADHHHMKKITLLQNLINSRRSIILNRQRINIDL
jgi:hypothetical protein